MKVFSNLAISLDGKIAPASRELFHLGTPADRARMQQLRKQADAVIMGASTLRAWKRPCLVSGSSRKLTNAVLSRALEGISPEWPFFKSERIERVLFVTGTVPAARLARFERTSRVIRLKGSAGSVVRELGKLGLKRLLVEGGGGVMWDFAREDLIDEYHVTLTPWILGGATAPTLVDGAGFSAAQALKLKLVRSRRVGQELYLTYARR